MTTYRSKIGLVIILPALPIFLGICALDIINDDWFALFIILLIAGFTTYLFRTTYYTINGNMLNVRSGFFVNTDIDIAKIKSVAETNTMWSAPAWSMDRIEIFYNTYDSVVISPPNKAQFIVDLQVINPNITVSLNNKK
ncbi:PH domain-containing protein [Mucilaginibacter sp. dw_454]|uniref:PH domain-containing protein n=1 Tax=Mucilaginibacter sp. dw_454 TaxID=2720079 RepID=UPI001BD5A76C|nr:PH domain-containing protein [Mucilaginibacter sp. dw_454]